MKITAERIADFFIQKAVDAKHEGELITNLKIQKLLYYAYAWHYSLQKERLFDDTIEAWDYGPVVPRIYYKYKPYGHRAIEETETNPDLLPRDVKEYLNSIWYSYGHYSAEALSKMTHREEPWLQSYDSRSEYPNKIIEDDIIERFYTEENADSLLPENTIIIIRNNKKTLAKLNDDFVKRLNNPQYEEFDMNTL